MDRSRTDFPLLEIFFARRYSSSLWIWLFANCLSSRWDGIRGWNTFVVETGTGVEAGKSSDEKIIASLKTGLRTGDFAELRRIILFFFDGVPNSTTTEEADTVGVAI